MQSIRRPFVIRVVVFAVAVALAACSDSSTQPIRNAATRGGHGLRDDDSVSNWGDTLVCTHGWLIVNYLVHCGPE